MNYTYRLATTTGYIFVGFSLIAATGYAAVTVDGDVSIIGTALAALACAAFYVRRNP